MRDCTVARAVPGLPPIEGPLSTPAWIAPMSRANRAEVIVVGAGPTGLMLGVQLARRGVHPLIVDRNPGPSVFSKALGVHARSLEIYSHLGIAERALELGMRAAAADLWVEGHRAARVPLGDIGCDLSPYPFLLILAQDKNEQLLGEVLRSLGGEVSWSTELVDIEQRTGSASAVLRMADGSTRTVEARWIAGCDGPHSVVRELCGIDFSGAPYEHAFYVADTTATGPMAPAELNVYLRRKGFQVFFPMRGQDRWRVVGILPRELSNRDNLEFAAVAPSIREQVGPSLMFQECRWFSTYRIHHRRAERFRARRCFLLSGTSGHSFGLTSFEPSAGVALIYEKRSVNGPSDEYTLRAYDDTCDKIYMTTSRIAEIKEFALLTPASPGLAMPTYAIMLNALLGALILLVLVLILKIRSLTGLLDNEKTEDEQPSTEG